jgi:hypothetical protein
MATEVFINIKDLPELTEVKNGDYIIVETSTGTSIINFENFIIPTSNSIITTTVNQNTDGLIVLSATTTKNSTNIDTVSSNVEKLMTDVDYLSSRDNNSTVLSLSTKIDTNTTNISILNDSLNNMSQTYVGKVKITIPTGGSYETGTISPLNSSIAAEDIVITPANGYATSHMAYVHSVTNGAIKLSATSVATQDAIYNVMAFQAL